MRSRNGIVVRVLSFHQCVQGSIMEQCYIHLLSLPHVKGFSYCPKKQHFHHHHHHHHHLFFFCKCSFAFSSFLVLMAFFVIMSYLQLEAISTYYYFFCTSSAREQTTSTPFVFLQSVESRAKKTGHAKVGRTKAVVWAKGEKKGLQTEPQRLTYVLLPQCKNGIG